MEQKYIYQQWRRQPTKRPLDRAGDWSSTSGSAGILTAVPGHPALGVEARRLHDSRRDGGYMAFHAY